MEVKFKSEDGKILDPNNFWWERGSVIIDELEIEIKGVYTDEAAYIEQAQKTEYGEILIETIINNSKFDLETFMHKMELEEIIPENSSKIAISAQGTKYHEDRDYPEDAEIGLKEIFRIVTKEQANIIRQCVEKNRYYNFMGATDENHGFDIETFGLNFISQLDYGLNEYTYESMITNPQLMKQIKSNPQAAQYVAQAVNEHIKIRRNIEGYRDSTDKCMYNRYREVEYYLYDKYLSESEIKEKERILKERQEEKQIKIFQKMCNTSEEDLHDSEMLYMKRMQDLEEMYEKGSIEMFEPFTEDELSFGGYGSTEIDVIKLETLKEENATEYLKKSGRRMFEVKDKEKEYLTIKHDEKENEMSSLKSISQLEIEHNTEDSQLKENILKKAFKKIRDNIKRLFNKKLPSTFEDNQTSEFGFKNRQKKFFESNRVYGYKLLKQDTKNVHNEMSNEKSDWQH